MPVTRLDLAVAVKMAIAVWSYKTEAMIVGSLAPYICAEFHASGVDAYARISAGLSS